MEMIRLLIGEVLWMKLEMHIENIAGCELCKKGESVEDVLVVYCAKHPAHNFTTVVGWYKHATVFRHYQEIEFGEGDFQSYNSIAKTKDCVLLPTSARSKILQWKVPRKTGGCAYGFGRANVWYASEDDKWIKEFLERLSSQIESYSGENIIRESE